MPGLYKFSFYDKEMFYCLGCVGLFLDGNKRATDVVRTSTGNRCIGAGPPNEQ